MKFQIGLANQTKLSFVLPVKLPNVALRSGSNEALAWCELREKFVPPPSVVNMWFKRNCLHDMVYGSLRIGGHLWGKNCFFDFGKLSGSWLACRRLEFFWRKHLTPRWYISSFLKDEQTLIYEQKVSWEDIYTTFREQKPHLGFWASVVENRNEACAKKRFNDRSATLVLAKAEVSPKQTSSIDIFRQWA